MDNLRNFVNTSDRNAHRFSKLARSSSFAICPLDGRLAPTLLTRLLPPFARRALILDAAHGWTCQNAFNELFGRTIPVSGNIVNYGDRRDVHVATKRYEDVATEGRRLILTELACVPPSVDYRLPWIGSEYLELLEELG